MKKQIGFALSLLGIFSVSTVLFGCGGGSAAPPISVSLTLSVAQSIDQGQTVSLTVQ